MSSSENHLLFLVGKVTSATTVWVVVKSCPGSPSLAVARSSGSERLASVEPAGSLQRNSFGISGGNEITNLQLWQVFTRSSA